MCLSRVSNSFVQHIFIEHLPYLFYNGGTLVNKSGIWKWQIHLMGRDSADILEGDGRSLTMLFICRKRIARPPVINDFHNYSSEWQL